MGKKLMILGNGPSKNKGLNIVRADNMRLCELGLSPLEHGIDTWSTNFHLQDTENGLIDTPNLRMLFQVHGRELVDIRFKDHYQTFPVKVPLVLVGAPSLINEFPTAVMFPMDEYLKRFPFARILIDNADAVADGLGYGAGMPLEEYHACSMSYMVALAAMLGIYDKLYIYGVDFDHRLRHESSFEKGCVETHITAALQMRPEMTVQIPAECWLFASHENIRMHYGSEYNPPFSKQEKAAIRRK